MARFNKLNHYNVPATRHSLVSHEAQRRKRRPIAEVLGTGPRIKYFKYRDMEFHAEDGCVRIVDLRQLRRAGPAVTYPDTPEGDRQRRRDTVETTVILDDWVDRIDGLQHEIRFQNETFRPDERVEREALIEGMKALGREVKFRGDPTDDSDAQYMENHKTQTRVKPMILVPGPGDVRAVEATRNRK